MGLESAVIFPLGWFQSLLFLLQLGAQNWSFALSQAWDSLLQALPKTYSPYSPTGLSLNHTPQRGFPCLLSNPGSWRSHRLLLLRSERCCHTPHSAHTVSFRIKEPRSCLYPSCQWGDLGESIHFHMNGGSSIHNVDHLQSETGYLKMWRNYTHDTCLF